MRFPLLKKVKLDDPETVFQISGDIHLNTVASLKSPVAGSPVRLNATAPVWPTPFQRSCARSIAAAGFEHSIGSPTMTLVSATSNGNATKCSPGHRLSHSIVPILAISRHGLKLAARIADGNGGL
jgi:hypothetical protein